MTLDQAVTRDPKTMSGALCFKGTRVPVRTLFDHLAAGELQEFYTDFPGVTPDMVDAVLEASESRLEQTIQEKKAA